MAEDKFERIETFNWLVGVVLAELLRSFPEPAPIPYAEEPPEPFTDAEEYKKFLRNTVNWMVNECALQIGGLKIDHDNRCVLANPRPGIEANIFSLSASALAALNVEIEALGITVKQAVEQGDKSGLENAGGTLSYILGRFTSGIIDGRM